MASADAGQKFVEKITGYVEDTKSFEVALETSRKDCARCIETSLKLNRVRETQFSNSEIEDIHIAKHVSDLLSSKFARKLVGREISFSEVLGEKLSKKLLKYFSTLDLGSQIEKNIQAEAAKYFLDLPSKLPTQYRGIILGSIKAADRKNGLNLLGVPDFI